MAATKSTRNLIEKTHLLSKFQGCLVGALVGDCVGAVFEGDDVVKKDRLQRCIDKVSSGTNEVYQFTDDTAMARSVAKSLIANKSVNVQDLARRFTEEFYKEPDRGYGASVGTVFAALRDSNYSDPHVPAQLQFDGRGSYGNGGAMRISPHALYAYKHDSTTMQKEVEDITKITHSNKDAILGAQLEFAAVHYTLHQEPPLVASHFLDHLVSIMKKLENPTELEKPEEPEGKRLKQDEPNTSADKELCYSEKLEKIKEFLSEENVDDEKVVDILGNNVSALGSVTTAVYSFLRAQKPMSHIPKTDDDNVFTRTIIHAISLGGDTDTIATMAGAMSGALCGLESIPLSWRNCCESIQDYLQFAKDLTDIVHS